MDQDILVHIVSVELADAGFFQSDHVAAVTIPASKLRDVDVRVSFVVAINETVLAENLVVCSGLAVYALESQLSRDDFSGTNVL